MTSVSKDNPGVYVPPPLLYVLFFFFSIFLQRIFPLPIPWQRSAVGDYIAWTFIVCHLIFFIPAIVQFIASRNTLITIKGANTLQTSGIFSISRNPMYLSLLFLYSGMAIFKGNLWTYIEIPLVVLVVQHFVIKKEEQYLRRRFNEEFEIYKRSVRRWI